MIVEDEALVAFALEDAVIAAGCSQAFLAQGVQEAFGVLARERIDFALLDLHLRGDETSLPVADALTRLGVPFAFVTGSDTRALRRRYPSALAIGKPAEDRLIRALAEALLSARARRQAAKAADWLAASGGTGSARPGLC